MTIFLWYIISPLGVEMHQIKLAKTVKKLGKVVERATHQLFRSAIHAKGTLLVSPVNLSFLPLNKMGSHNDTKALVDCSSMSPRLGCRQKVAVCLLSLQVQLAAQKLPIKRKSVLPGPKKLILHRARCMLQDRHH
ncbi:uncharacterized [Tachysurus ichikawai]